MTIGEKIRSFRINLGLSQKELAKMVHLSESAVRNYELGNRMPSEIQLEKISEALNVSKYAISNPDLSTHIGIMHALFYLEEHFDLIVSNDKENNYNNMRFDSKTNNGFQLNDNLSEWIKKRIAFESNSISADEYKKWKTTFPKQLIEEHKNSSLKQIKKSEK